MPFTIGYIDMFTIFVQQNDQWVEFLPLARELGYVSQKEADCIKDYSLEEVAKVISYFGNEVQILPPCSFWKVVGPAGHTLPGFIHSIYEAAA
jgi:hypothetical protein